MSSQLTCVLTVPVAQEAFHSLPVDAGTTSQLRGLPSAGDMSGAVRINVRKGSRGVIHFVNNLEKDEQYQRYVAVSAAARVSVTACDCLCLCPCAWNAG